MLEERQETGDRRAVSWLISSLQTGSASAFSSTQLRQSQMRRSQQVLLRTWAATPHARTIPGRSSDVMRSEPRWCDWEQRGQQLSCGRGTWSPARGIKPTNRLIQAGSFCCMLQSFWFIAPTFEAPADPEDPYDLRLPICCPPTHPHTYKHTHTPLPQQQQTRLP